MTDHKIPVNDDIASPEDRAKIIAAGRALLDFLERTPELPISRWSSVGFHMSDKTLGSDPLATSPRRVAKLMARGGRVNKTAYDWTTDFNLRVDFDGAAYYSFSFDRSEICAAKVVGEREKTEIRYSDEERAKELEAELEKLSEKVVVGTEPIVEYDCAPLLSGS